jgi:hypothetical protein
MDRRKFLTMFAAGSVGMTVADKIGFLSELKNWVLSPKKTIFIPPEPKIEWQPWDGPWDGPWQPMMITYTGLLPNTVVAASYKNGVWTFDDPEHVTKMWSTGTWKQSPIF